MDGARARMLRRSWRQFPRGGPHAHDRRIARARPAHGATPSSACRTARDRWLRCGIITDTFETAITWDRFRNLPRPVEGRRPSGDQGRNWRPGQVTCRFTHAYPDGPAPYFSFQRRADTGSLTEQWRRSRRRRPMRDREVGGTITHHHAVGRDHRPWYDRQRPDLFARGAESGQAGARPARDSQSGSADRS